MIEPAKSPKALNLMFRNFNFVGAIHELPLQASHCRVRPTHHPYAGLFWCVGRTLHKLFALGQASLPVIIAKRTLTMSKFLIFIRNDKKVVGFLSF
ncbi:MAG: hypothetical protein DYG83_11125 [Candidatus Brocadia sp. AMX2]|nr:MAG: hypothetical protein EDM70_08935 [Candidatus Brocadia sp. AMX2]MBC6933050.1 hypothetical protein [Candidatus Brocadia sp.]MCE7867358.1 hypothetical protein [Candidatus Brocadia sp. AMX2]MCQ3918037.1 hypothetical protein [Candidatus Brocadia sp.]